MPSPSSECAHLCCFDLEMNQPSGKIIQIGAVVGNLFDRASPARFSVLVDPGEPISPFIEELTGISTSLVETQGTEFRLAVVHFIEFVVANGSSSLPLGWGGEDLRTLREQYEQCAPERAALANSGDGNLLPGFPFGPRALDVRTLAQTCFSRRGKKTRGGLFATLTLAGLGFEGRAHDALDDAHNTFRLARHVLGESAEDAEVKGPLLGEGAERPRVNHERVRRILRHSLSERGFAAVARDMRVNEAFVAHALAGNVELSRRLMHRLLRGGKTGSVEDEVNPLLDEIFGEVNKM